MKIITYPLTKTPMPLVSGKREKTWMDNTVNRYAYRCLPLSIANSSGWEFLSPCDFYVEWDGNDHQDGLKWYYYSDDPHTFISSSFGCGIVTIHTDRLFRTEKGWNLYVTGSPNFGVPWAFPLSGIVETAWLDFTFTLNWKLHEAGKFYFYKGDPLGFIFPVPATIDIEAAEIDISDNPEQAKRYQEWAKERQTNIANMAEAFKTNSVVGGICPHTTSTHWEKNYMRGESKRGEKFDGHKTRVNYPEFKRTVVYGDNNFIKPNNQ